jgi:hypothetical protein
VAAIVAEADRKERERRLQLRRAVLALTASVSAVTDKP